MEIIKAAHCGFCYGVKRAIELAESSADGSGSVYTLGPIIHNPQLVNKLAEAGIVVIQSLDEVAGQKARVIIRSHGVGPVVYAQAKNTEIQLIDATCPYVKKAQMAARDLHSEGYQVIIIGEKNHPEVKSIVEWTAGQALVVETTPEARLLPKAEKRGVVAQTTFSGAQFDDIVAALKEQTGELKVKRTICNATAVRQQAAAELAAAVDVMIVVGGKNSANTTRLAQLCAEGGTITYHVETEDEISPLWFTETPYSRIGITAGASTPDWIIDRVEQRLRALVGGHQAVKAVAK